MVLPAWQPWLPISISFAGVLGALVYQIRRARFNQSIDLLFRLENDFFGPVKKRQRVKAAEDLLAGRPLEAEPVLDFFETMALLFRRRALDKEIVWHTFFYWIDRYYESSRAHIAERQASDPLVWRDLSLFIEELRRFQATQSNGRAYQPPDGAEIERFLREELTEGDDPHS